MRNVVCYLIIAVGLLTGIVVLCTRFWPEEQLDTPEVLADQIVQGESLEQQIIAARKMIRHGSQARGEVERVLVEYRGDDPEVIIPLVQAAGKAKAWRSIPNLFELMEHPDRQIRGKAGAAVRRIMGADYYFRAGDPEAKRKEKLDMMKRTYKVLKPELARLYDGEEQ
jgi:hypothetical protein